jgi:2-polyprenyl-3-methyl-5-hydroxy-6-metoxy-1,4-benzoquinol methylase
VYWIDRLEGRLSVTIHGESLSSELVRRHREKKAAMREKVGDARWTPEYQKIQKTFHVEQGENYGHRGTRHFELVSRALIGMYSAMRRGLSYCDYGCGNGALADEIESAFKFVRVKRYDPFFDGGKFSADPGPQDFFTCMDVMEHVEEECIDNTIDYIAERCRYGAIFAIATDEAAKTLPDGRNAHITVKLPQWWKEKLGRRFQIQEQQNHVHGVVFVAVSLGAVQRLEEERKVA